MTDRPQKGRCFRDNWKWIVWGFMPGILTAIPYVPFIALVSTGAEKFFHVAMLLIVMVGVPSGILLLLYLVEGNRWENRRREGREN